MGQGSDIQPKQTAQTTVTKLNTENTVADLFFIHISVRHH